MQPPIWTIGPTPRDCSRRREAQLPHYFFRVSNGQPFRDETGEEFTTMQLLGRARRGLHAMLRPFPALALEPTRASSIARSVTSLSNKCWSVLISQYEVSIPFSAHTARERHAAPNVP